MHASRGRSRPGLTYRSIVEAREARASELVEGETGMLAWFGSRNRVQFMPTPPRIDIRALLLIALDEKPPANLPDRVMARVAALTTMLEFARLLGAAPLDWLEHRRESSGSDDDGNDPDTS